MIMPECVAFFTNLLIMSKIELLDSAVIEDMDTARFPFVHKSHQMK